jgi:hypothetical protein
MERPYQNVSKYVEIRYSISKSAQQITKHSGKIAE